MSETTECLEITRETSKKVDMVVEAYQKKDRECDSKNNIIKWLIAALMTFIVVSGIVAGMFVYGYLYSPYLAGEVNNNNNGDGNAVIVNR